MGSNGHGLTQACTSAQGACARGFSTLRAIGRAVQAERWSYGARGHRSWRSGRGARSPFVGQWRTARLTFVQISLWERGLDAGSARSSVWRTSGYETEGHRFESCLAPHRKPDGIGAFGVFGASASNRRRRSESV